MTRYHGAYPAEFRRQMVELVRSRRTPDELARDLPAASTIRAIRGRVRCISVFADMATNSTRPGLSTDP